jgi:hypothetical protein
MRAYLIDEADGTIHISTQHYRAGRDVCRDGRQNASLELMWWLHEV